MSDEEDDDLMSELAALETEIDQENAPTGSDDVGATHDDDDDEMEQLRREISQEENRELDYQTKKSVDGLRLLQEIEVAEQSERAYQARKHRDDAQAIMSEIERCEKDQRELARRRKEASTALQERRRQRRVQHAQQLAEVAESLQEEPTTEEYLREREERYFRGVHRMSREEFEAREAVEDTLEDAAALGAALGGESIELTEEELKELDGDFLDSGKEEEYKE